MPGAERWLPQQPTIPLRQRMHVGAIPCGRPTTRTTSNHITRKTPFAPGDARMGSIISTTARATTRDRAYVVVVTNNVIPAEAGI